MRDDELRIFKARIGRWQWDAKPTAVPTGNYDLNKMIKELQSQTIQIEGALFFEPGRMSSVKIVDGTIAPVSMTNAQPQEPLTLDALMEAVSSLPPMPDMRPLRCNQWTLDRIREVFSSVPSNEGTSNTPGFHVPFGALEVELDEELADGIVKQSDKVLCNVKKEQGRRVYFDGDVTMNTIQKYLERAYQTDEYNPLYMVLSPQDHEKVGAQVREGTHICGRGGLSHYIEALEHFTRFVNQTTGQLMKVSVSQDVPIGAVDFDNEE